jgi:thiol-disulfide isomerase/thioredoxin
MHASSSAACPSQQAVLFFWASWSAPCKHMQQVLSALAQRHTGVKFLQVCMLAAAAAPSFAMLQRHHHPRQRSCVNTRTSRAG